MADRTKPVDKSIPASQRQVKWVKSEVTTGDVLRVADSLGRPADTITIEAAAGSDLAIIVNSKAIIYPRRQYPEEEVGGWVNDGEVNLAGGVEVNTLNPSITIGDATSKIEYSLNDIPIRDVKITFTTSATFTLIFS